MDVKYDRYSLIIDGKREFIWSGAIHYYRLPAVEQWPERIRMFKDAGLNAIDVYIPWNYHSEEEGKYNFGGNRDIERLFDEIEKAGLYLIARPGPYICSEIDAGGLPGWLLAKKRPVLRCRREGELFYDDEYMKYVREWWEQVVPRAAARDNLLLFQVENEFTLMPEFFRPPLKNILNFVRKYKPDALMWLMNTDVARFFQFKLAPQLMKKAMSSPERNQYVKKLFDWSRELGIEVPIFHNDVMSRAGRVVDVDIMAIDDYAITDFREDWRKKGLVFAAIDEMEEGLDLFNNENPLFIAEFQGSWFDNWGGFGYDTIREKLGTDQLDLATKSALAQRATLINYFMFSGGTTWGYLGSPDVYTSYDMASPITEWGEKSRRYRVIEWMIEEIEKLGKDFLETEHDETVRCTPSRIFCRARKSPSGKRYVFLRNLSNRAAKCKLNISDEKTELNKTQMCVLVFDKTGRLENTINPHTTGQNPEKHKKHEPLPELVDWKLSWASPQIDEDFDASGWRLLENEKSWDLDALGTHYGFGWYRGTYRGRLGRIEIDARHCLSVYLNGKLVASKDNFRNTSGVGDDVAQEFEIPIPSSLQHGEMNAITVLVESLGHNKDFECDARNPRGIVSMKCRGAKVVWRFRGGLLDGEKGLCPVLPRKSFRACKPKEKVTLPHFWEPYDEGIGLYETEFDLDIGESERGPVGVVIPEALSKANIYVNGYLMGRYWHEKGPQHKFFVPWGVLDPSGRNHLAIAVWKRWETGCLGNVRLEYF